VAIKNDAWIQGVRSNEQQPLIAAWETELLQRHVKKVLKGKEAVQTELRLAQTVLDGFHTVLIVRSVVPGHWEKLWRVRYGHLFAR
jgi:hypothetical protein